MIVNVMTQHLYSTTPKRKILWKRCGKNVEKFERVYFLKGCISRREPPFPTGVEKCTIYKFSC